MGKLWKKVIKPFLFGQKTGLTKSYFKETKRFPWTIYGKNMRVKDWAKRFEHIHGTIKYRLLIPFLYLGELILGKKLRTVPDKGEWYDANLSAFDKAFEKSIYDWKTIFLPHCGREVPQTEEVRMKNLKAPCGGEDVLRLMKKYGMAFVLEDTAYREFFNILLLNIAVEINKIHADEKKDVANHLLYTRGNIADIQYFMLGNSILHGQCHAYNLTLKKDQEKNLEERQVK